MEMIGSGDTSTPRHSVCILGDKALDTTSWDDYNIYFIVVISHHISQKLQFLFV